MSRKVREAIAIPVVLVVVALVAVGLFAFTGMAGGADTVGAANPDSLFLVTTSSVNDTGLMDKLKEKFEARYPGITLTWASKGSGGAIADGDSGNCDAIIVHSPTDEKLHLSWGHYTARFPFAYNYFTIVGRDTDPANVNGSLTAVQAFKRIAAYGKKSGKQVWVSRADNSGTYKMEMAIWAKAGVTIDPANPPVWYVSANTTMLATLQIAAQKKAYTLTDLATWIKNKTTSSLSPPLVRLFKTRDSNLKNQYSILLVNSLDHPEVNAAAAEMLAEYLTCRNGQRDLGAYKMGTTTMFYPNSYIIATTPCPPAATPPPAAAP